MTEDRTQPKCGQADARGYPIPPSEPTAKDVLDALEKHFLIEADRGVPLRRMDVKRIIAEQREKVEGDSKKMDALEEALFRIHPVSGDHHTDVMLARRVAEEIRKDVDARIEAAKLLPAEEAVPADAVEIKVECGGGKSYTEYVDSGAADAIRKQAVEEHDGAILDRVEDAKRKERERVLDAVKEKVRLIQHERRPSPLNQYPNPYGGLASLGFPRVDQLDVVMSIIDAEREK